MRNVILVGAALMSAACAPSAGPPAASAMGGRQCFNARSVNDFHAIGRDAVIVTAGVNRYYQLGIIGVCPEIDWSSRVALRSTSGSSWICQGLDAEFLVPSPSGLQRCPVVSVQPLSPEVARASIARHR